MDEEIQNIENHVEAGDYFGTLATILSLISQKLDKESTDGTDTTDDVIENLNKLVNDLKYLQAYYKIVKK